MHKRFSALIVLPLLAACSDNQPSATLPTFDDPQLAQGMNTWTQVCRNCHLTGVAGAPSIRDVEAWQQRLVKGKAELYRSAINGIPNEHGWSMPPKGGVDRLTDVQVRLAVDYMLAAQARMDAQRQP